MRGFAGILGINRRNLELVQPGRRDRRAVIDDKLATKAVLRAAGVDVPPDLAVVSSRIDVGRALNAIRAAGRAAIKPARGLGGNGLLLAGPHHRDEDLRFHLTAILSGAYSRGGEGDRPVVEPLLADEDELARVHGGSGLADVRIVVRDGVAAMAMLRLPCAGSGGAANLHAGGVGVGIDVARGRTTSAIRRGRGVDAHPDSGLTLAGIAIPAWDHLVVTAERMNAIFDLAYLGVDLVIDRERGPLVLEVNARPGLAVQIASGEGLRARFDQRRRA